MEWLFLLIAFGADIMGTVAGFGSSTIALPFALFLFDFPTALVLVAFLHMFGNIGRIGFFRFGLDKKTLFAFGVPSVIATFVSALLIAYVPHETLKGVLGFFLVAYTLLTWKENLHIRPTAQNVILGGSISGFFAGLIGTGGAIRGAFLNAFGSAKDTYIATAAAIALAVDATRIPVYLNRGFLEPRFYSLIPLIFIASILGAYCGKLIVRHIAQEQFRRIVLIALFLVGAWFAYGWIRA